jgi:hypothetical protein
MFAVYVDDILIAGPSIKSCNTVVGELSHHIEVVNKGKVKSFIGLNIVRNSNQHAVSISQLGYIDRLLTKYNMMNAKSVSIPFVSSMKLKAATMNDSLYNVE